MKLNILPSECDCEICSIMCHAPCCGTLEDIDRLIEAGFADRLMYDDYPGIVDEIIKPALKNYEGQRAPWETNTLNGCTFWKDGKCELHDLGLKPIQGKLAHHDNSEDEIYAIEEMLVDSWTGKGVEAIIQKWKSKVNYES